MNIIVPIFFAAVLTGLFARRMTPTTWAALAVFIFLIIAYPPFEKLAAEPLA